MFECCGGFSSSFVLRLCDERVGATAIEVGQHVATTSQHQLVLVVHQLVVVVLLLTAMLLPTAHCAAFDVEGRPYIRDTYTVSLDHVPHPAFRRIRSTRSHY